MFSLRLDSVTGQGAVLGSPSEITITILEDGRLRPALDSVFCKVEILNKVTKQREERQADEKEKKKTYLAQTTGTLT